MSASGCGSATRYLVLSVCMLSAGHGLSVGEELAARVARAPSMSRLPDEPAPDGGLLRAAEVERQLITDQVRAEVEQELRAARAEISRQPAAVEQSLKLMLTRVVQTPELSAETRSQLRGQLETALRESNRVAATQEILDQQRMEAEAAALERLRVAGALERKEEKIKQLMERFDSLMDEGRYVAADEIGEQEVQRIAPELPISYSAGMVAHMTGARLSDLALRQARAKAVIDTLGTVEVSLMPFPDDQPVVYPPAEVWQELTDNRKQFVSTDLKKVSPREKKIREVLVDADHPTKMEFTETPLHDAMDYLGDLHGIEIQLDSKALEDAGISSDTPVTRNLGGVTLRSGLRLLLRDMDLTYLVKDEVLLITTKDRADTELVTKAYPVADLVIPIRSMRGGMGMMGGGMMGGMGGGGMGGGMMGGMGGGMGGGMMGGMGGGMGGGMF